MQILTDIRLLARGGTSGIEEYTRNLITNLLKIDQKNEYLFFYNSFRKNSVPEFPKTIDWHIPNKILDLGSRLSNFPQIDSFIKADLIFSPHFNILSRKKTPRVITFHDLSFLHHPRFFSWRQRFWHWLQNVEKQAREADHLIAVSEFTKSDLVDFFHIPEEKISVVYSGISEKFKKIDTKNPPKTGREKPFILYLGTLEPRKNIPAIIRAFNLLKKTPKMREFQLIIAGKPGWLWGEILSEVAKSPYAEDIIFKGPVNEAEKIALYSAASVFVYPSFFEGFGFPPLEAQACGCPVVVSERTSLPEVVGDSALFADPWRVGTLAEAIEKIISNERLKADLIERGYHNIKRFNWRKTAEETLEVFSCYG